MGLSMAPQLRVIICAYNAAPWVKRCLRSLLRQGYRDFRCIFVDDASSDGTAERAREIIGDDDRFVVREVSRVGSALQNRVYGIREIATGEDDVIVVVDADDWLAHDDVLQRVAEIYADPDVWLTYGSHVRYRGTLRDRLGWRLKSGEAKRYPDPIVEHRLFRFYRFRASHLRTYRRFLWDAVREDDLKTPEGAWIGPGCDVAEMIPMLEMAGGEHIQFLPETLYIYNDANALSDRRVNQDEQILNATRIATLPVYPPLERAARVGA